MSQAAVNLAQAVAFRDSWPVGSSQFELWDSRAREAAVWLLWVY